VSFNWGRSVWLLAKACRHLANDYTLLILSQTLAAGVACAFWWRFRCNRKQNKFSSNV